MLHNAALPTTDVQTILVVDDEPNMRFAIRSVLESAGYTVLEAPHGAAALELAAESRPDAVITDLMMPVMDGHELIERFRAAPATATIPIIVVSAVAGSLATSAEFVLGKPFKPEVLLEAVGALGRTAS